MVYREVSMIEIKEILLRIVSKSSIRDISESLSIHRDTIKTTLSLQEDIDLTRARIQKT